MGDTNDDIEDDNKPNNVIDSKSGIEPRIKSQSKDILAQIGETVWLPCETTTTGKRIPTLHIFIGTSIVTVTENLYRDETNSIPTRAS